MYRQRHAHVSTRFRRPRDARTAAGRPPSGSTDAAPISPRKSRSWRAPRAEGYCRRIAGGCAGRTWRTATARPRSSSWRRRPAESCGSARRAHLRRMLELRFVSRVRDRRRALRGRSPAEAMLDGALSLGGADVRKSKSPIPAPTSSYAPCCAGPAFGAAGRACVELRPAPGPGLPDRAADERRRVLRHVRLVPGEAPQGRPARASTPAPAGCRTRRGGASRRARRALRSGGTGRDRRGAEPAGKFFRETCPTLRMAVGQRGRDPPMTYIPPLIGASLGTPAVDWTDDRSAMPIRTAAGSRISPHSASGRPRLACQAAPRAGSRDDLFSPSATSGLRGVRRGRVSRRGRSARRLGRPAGGGGEAWTQTAAYGWCGCADRCGGNGWWRDRLGGSARAYRGSAGDRRESRFVHANDGGAYISVAFSAHHAPAACRPSESAAAHVPGARRP